MIPPRPIFRPFLDSGSYSSAGGAAGGNWDGGNRGNRKRPKRSRRRASGRATSAKNQRKPFLWALITTLNLFLAVCIWVAISTLISQPERPICYKILGMLGKQTELKTLERNDLATSMEGLNATEAQQKYGNLNHLQMEDLNTQLLRGYITNFRRSQQVPIIEGEFELIGARLLTQNDLIESGMVLLTRSSTADRGTLYLEYILPTPADQVPELGDFEYLLQNAQASPVLKLRAGKQLAALTHVAYLDNSEMLLSAIPVSYQSPRFSDGQTVAVAAPTKINLKGRLPIYDPLEINYEAEPTELAGELAWLFP